MIYAIITTGGKQYKVEENKDIVIGRIEGKEGDKVTIEEINLLSNEGKVSIGAPGVKNAKVEATIKEQIKGDKVIAFKHKAKKRYNRKVGHRQLLTVLHLDKIKTGK
ncbi:MAG: 50S ribosomal protein L21 [Candidatus Humimicrobiaceae bacterium]